MSDTHKTILNRMRDDKDWVHEVVTMELRVSSVRSLLQTALSWMPYRLREVIAIETLKSLPPQLSETAFPGGKLDRSIRACAGRLAVDHMRDDHELQQVLWAPASNEIRLLEVSSAVPYNGEALPFRFAADPPNIPYSTVVVLLHPDEYRAVQSGKLQLPHGFGNLQVIASREQPAKPQ